MKQGKVNLSKSTQLSRVTLNIMLLRDALGQFLGALWQQRQLSNRTMPGPGRKKCAERSLQRAKQRCHCPGIKVHLQHAQDCLQASRPSPTAKGTT